MIHPYIASIWNNPSTLEEAAIVGKIKFIRQQLSELRLWVQQENPYQLRGIELTNWSAGVAESIGGITDSELPRIPNSSTPNGKPGNSGEFDDAAEHSGPGAGR